jgi:hypothetical protein
VLAIPGLTALVEAARRGRLARVAAAALTALVVQFAQFLHVYRTVGPRRTELFEAGVPARLSKGFAGADPVYTDFDDRYAQTHALWYAPEHGIPRAEGPKPTA